MNFLIISNMRSGSTWLQMMLGQLGDVVTDFELKWKPSYKLEKLHVAINDKSFSFNSFFSNLGEQPIKGAKLTFDFFPPADLKELTECLPSDLAIIHLTRNYFEVLNSFYRGICHDYDEPWAIGKKSPAIHNALQRSNERYVAIKNFSPGKLARKVDKVEVAKYLDIFLSVDQWASGLSIRQAYLRVDYSQVNNRFVNIARFIGSEAPESSLLKIVRDPPTKKLRTETVIENECEIRDLVKAYERRKALCFGFSQLKRLVRI